MYQHAGTDNFKVDQDKDQFFRKAVDSYTHDQHPEGRINDPKHQKMSISMEGKNIETSNSFSTDYLKSIIDTKNIPMSRQKLLIELIERRIDHRTLSKLKTHMFDHFPEHDITVEEWKKES